MTDPAGTFPRRTALKAGFAVGLAGLLVPALNGCTTDGVQDSVTVAGGEPGGFYLEFAGLLAEALQRHGVARRATALTTGGSLDNLEDLLSGKATLAVALSDSAALRAAEGGDTAVGITAVGKVYENYVHCVVRQDSGIRDIAGLAGRTVAVGEPGSGTSLTTPRLLEAAGLLSSAAAGHTAEAASGTVTVLNLGLNEGIAALQAGSVDALFWSGGVPTAAIAAAHTNAGLALLDLSPLLPALRAKYGLFYDRVLIPEGAYPGIPPVWTVGVANLLLCRADADARMVRKTVEILVDHAEELVPRSSLGVQFLSPESLINTPGLPLHPAASAAYRDLHG
ncbi:TAXI family TRAP transporter solute-binding subunit [Pseudarthrobacter sulfonivorans]|uniref:TAXI family TRAP transporter solute-binding subunit n=1 Tax=Pseudarthrobacter sulfonivorans TaxID=121292 RepID=UPI0021072E0F|nr:TAXI family TRAP transporter solute-binding subunit [Pseudarthrobacter sulfonivorans]